MRKALGNIERALIFLVQLDRHMLEVRGTLRTQVDNDVKDGAACAADELGFGRRRKLEMHAAQRPFFYIGCDIGLGDDGLQPVRLEFVLTKGPREKASRVFPALQVNNKGAAEFS